MEYFLEVWFIVPVFVQILERVYGSKLPCLGPGGYTICTTPRDLDRNCCYGKCCNYNQYYTHQASSVARCIYTEAGRTPRETCSDYPYISCCPATDKTLQGSTCCIPATYTPPSVYTTCTGRTGSVLCTDSASPLCCYGQCCDLDKFSTYTFAKCSSFYYENNQDLSTAVECLHVSSTQCCRNPKGYSTCCSVNNAYATCSSATVTNYCTSRYTTSCCNGKCCTPTRTYTTCSRYDTTSYCTLSRYTNCCFGRCCTLPTYTSCYNYQQTYYCTNSASTWCCRGRCCRRYTSCTGGGYSDHCTNYRSTQCCPKIYGGKYEGKSSCCSSKFSIYTSCKKYYFEQSADYCTDRRSTKCCSRFRTELRCCASTSTSTSTIRPTRTRSTYRTSSTWNTKTGDSERDGEVDVGAAVGGVIGGIVVIAVIIGVCCSQKSASRRAAARAEPPPVSSVPVTAGARPTPQTTTDRQAQPLIPPYVAPPPQYSDLAETVGFNASNNPNDTAVSYSPQVPSRGQDSQPPPPSYDEVVTAADGTFT